MNIKNALDQLLDAFDLFPPSSQKSTMLYDSNKLQRILLEKEALLIFKDQEQINKLDSISGKFGSLTSIMHKDPELAYTEYKILEQTDLHPLDEYNYLYVKQWVLSVEALYYYKIKNFNRAFNLSLECISLCDMMINMGLKTLILRLIEQNKNLARIYLVNGYHQKSRELEEDILNYLFNGEQTLLFGTSVRDSKNWLSVEYIREGYSYEYFRGVIHNLITLKKSNKEKGEIFLDIFKNMKFAVNTPDRKIIRDWLDLFILFYSESYEMFVEQLTQLLQVETSSIYDILKILALVNLKFIIEQANYHASGKINNLIGSSAGINHLVPKMQGKQFCYTLIMLNS